MDKLLQAAQTVVDVPLRYLSAGSNMAIAALAGAKQFEVWRHYPARDAVDIEHRTRFFYHAHACNNSLPNEHGHFHLFVYFPDEKAGATGAENFSHLVGIALDDKGQPLRWFTTNRWVTAETWRPAKDLLAVLPELQFSAKGRLAPVAQWLTAMLTLYRPQIAALLLERDARLAREIELLSALKKQRHGQKQEQEQVREPEAKRYAEIVLDDRELDVMSACSVSLSERVQEVIKSLNEVELEARLKNI